MDTLTATAGARRTAGDPRAIATPTVVAPRTPPDRARATRAPTVRARRTTMAEARLIRMRMAAALRLNTDKVRLTPMFMVAPLLARTARARTTPALTAPTVTIRPLLRTTTHQDATTAVAWQPAPPSRAPQLRVPRLARLQPQPTLPRLLRTLTMPATVPAQLAARQRRPLIRWARSLRAYLRAASLPLSRARPTTCVAIAGSVRPTAQTASTTAWYLLPEAASYLFSSPGKFFVPTI